MSPAERGAPRQVPGQVCDRGSRFHRSEHDERSGRGFALLRWIDKHHELLLCGSATVFKPFGRIKQQQEDNRRRLEVIREGVFVQTEHS